MTDAPAGSDQTTVVEDDAAEQHRDDTETSGTTQDDQPSGTTKDERTTTQQGTVPGDELGDVDDAVKQQIRGAYLNDSHQYLVVTDVTTGRDERTIIVEFQPPYGGATHVERFTAPTDGSMAGGQRRLANCSTLLAFRRWTSTNWSVPGSRRRTTPTPGGN